MKRNEIDAQLTWNLRFLFGNQEAFEAQYAQAQKEVGLLQSALPSLAVDKDSFISFMEHQETLERYLDNLISYAKMSCDVDPEHTQNQENLARSYTLYQQVSQALSTLPLVLIQNREQIEQWLETEECRELPFAIRACPCGWKRGIFE